MKKIQTPLTPDIISSLHSGDDVLISGVLYTMRDAAHKRVVEMLESGKNPPLDLNNQVVYYCGPTPARPGNIIGSCGPTTSGRMDKYTPKLLELGLKGMIGKGSRSDEIKEAIKKYKAVYFSGLGGLGAEYALAVKKSEVIAFPDLGPEAIYRLEVTDFNAVVINDIHGGDFYLNL